jgi:hypothetical protein
MILKVVDLITRHLTDSGLDGLMRTKKSPAIIQGFSLRYRAVGY